MTEPDEDLSPQTILRERDLARRWQKSVRFLQRQRATASGPPWLRIGASIYYRAEDVLAFEAARLHVGRKA